MLMIFTSCKSDLNRFQFTKRDIKGCFEETAQAMNINIVKRVAVNLHLLKSPQTPSASQTRTTGQVAAPS